jgi:hypothetical protein
MAVLAAQFRAHMAGFGYECFDNDFVQRTLNYAAGWCPLDCWGNRHIDGVCFLAAHLMSSQMAEIARLAATGAQSAEGKQFTPRTPYSGTTDDMLQQTFSGGEYLRLRRLVVGLTATVANF